MSDRTPALYVGSVSHMRMQPRRMAFRQRLYMPLVDVRDLSRPPGSGALWGHRFSPMRFTREDFLGDPHVPLGDAVRALVGERLGTHPAGEIRLLAHQRTFGWLFNPVAFYFCDDGSGDLMAIVADVVNTPWHERHSYVLDMRDRRAECEDVVKAMHVSPLQPMDLTYRFRFGHADPASDIVITARRQGRVVFSAHLAMRQRQLTRRTLLSVLLRTPLVTLRVSLGIYARAALLWLRGARFHGHPAAASPQTSRDTH